MFFVFPVKDIADGLETSTNMFCEAYALPAPKEPAIYVKIIQEIVDDCVQEKMIWCDYTGDIVSKLSQYIPWFEDDYDKVTKPTRRTKLSDDYYTHTVDHIQLQVNQILSEWIGLSTWNVWHTRPLGDDVLLEKGEDYRAVEFTRLVENGSIENIDQRLKKKLIGR